MSDWKEESIRRRDVRSGIGLEKERTVGGTGSSRSKGGRNWVIVYLSVDTGSHNAPLAEQDIKYQINIWGEYRHEAEAKLLVDRDSRSGYTNRYKQFYCERQVYDMIKLVLR